MSVPCVSDSCLPYSLIDDVIITPELVPRGFVVCLDMEGGHGDFWEEDILNPVHQEEMCLLHGSTG
jgi:hypothetical protein